MYESGRPLRYRIRMSFYFVRHLMKKLAPALLVALTLLLSCKKSNNPNTPTAPNNPPPHQTNVESAYLFNDYDATYTHNSPPFYTFSYHVRQKVFYQKDSSYQWKTWLYNASDTFYSAYEVADSSVANRKGCFALISSIDTSQQPNYPYYIGSYYKFSLFADTAVGNLQFMIPASTFPSIDSVKLNTMYYFSGGVNSFYSGMTNAEVKLLPDFSDFVRAGDNFSYANPQLPAQGVIDSAEAYIYPTRFSNNYLQPDTGVTKTMDANYGVKLYFSDGSYFTLINGKFTNLFFRKKSM